MSCSSEFIFLIKFLRVVAITGDGLPVAVDSAKAFSGSGLIEPGFIFKITIFKIQLKLEINDRDIFIT